LTSTSKGETVASLTGPTVALLNSSYNNISHKQIYGTRMACSLNVKLVPHRQNFATRDCSINLNGISGECLQQINTDRCKSSEAPV
ncbi:hypothetical protein, partial [Rhizobium acidisoli]|uniref:hypothetical protein n=1 Tax=Rhizobium acidisoli TaxID=1538158 RepID=UPI001AEC0FD5